MKCDEFKKLLGSVIDGRASALEADGFERHVKECDACAREFSNTRLISRTIRDGRLTHKAPEHLRQRVAMLAQAPVQRARVSRVRMLYAAASVLIAIGGIWTVLHFAGASPDDLIARDAVAGHIRSLMAGHLTDVVSTDRHTVKPWFNGKLPFSPRVEDFSAHDFKLVGGRLDFIGDAPVAALVYQRRQHLLNLFTWPARDAADLAEQKINTRGYNVLHWRAAGMEYWLVSELNMKEMEEFRRLFEEH